MSSLKLRLAVGLSLSLLLLLGLQYWLVSGAIRDTAEGYVAERLRHDTEGLLAGLTFGPDGPRMTASDAIYRRPYSGHYYRVQVGDRIIRSRSLWDADLPRPEVAVGEVRRRHADGPRDQPLLVRSAAFRKSGETVRVVAAEDLSSLKDELTAFQWRYALVSLAVAAALLAIQWALIALGLRPLSDLRDEIGALERGDRQGLSEDVPAEIRPLVRELNRLLGVLGERLERSRNALGNLAHGLKSPLTRLFQSAEDPAIATDGEPRQEILEPARAIQDRIDRELGRARLAAGAPGQRFDPGREIPALIRTMERIHADRNLTIRYHGPDPGTPFGDREDLLELAGNLLDNACKWATSEVRVTLALDRGMDLTVADDGPGVPVAHRDGLLGRESRLDETAEGQGLGLAIVGDIVEAYGGRLELGESPTLHGLAVHVVLP
ncbi:sensor histidine kinase [Thiohalorhabdus sp.]|uniref:sensor histidine kinase n=1 Tax=Thiohalorhabdus sp. TaxID=3094134 RepID=UPI002FC332BE